MLAGVSPASKHKLRLVIQIRLEIHESSYPLKNKPALKEMAAAPIEEGSKPINSHVLVLDATCFKATSTREAVART